MIIKPIKELSIKELRMESKIMADILNKRLRRIEKQNLTSSSVFYEYVQKYGNQKKNFIGYTGHGEIKYITSFSKFNRGELISIYKALQSGMKASTSTVTGTKQSIDKKRKALEKWFADNESEMGNVNVQDVNDIFKTARETGFLNTYGSDTVMKMANSGKNVATVQDRIRKIDDVSDKLKKGQIANTKVIKSMQLNDRDFQTWLDEQEMSDFTRALRRTNANVVKTDEQREFDKLASKTKRNANALTKEENEIATISKRLNKNLKKKK